MSAHTRVADLIEIILNSVAQEARVTQDQLSVEIESVVTRGVLEAFKRGEDYAHDRPTDPALLTPTRSFPATRLTPTRGFPATRLTPSQPMQRPKPPTPQPRRYTPPPIPRQDKRQDED